MVFTLGASCESRRRHLLPAGSVGVEESLHRACLGQALDAGRAAGCRVEVASPEQLDLPVDVHQRSQSGNGFGERLSTALEAAFTERRGSVPVILVGSDVPGLADSHVRRTLELLAEDPERVVVGPSPDGGFYLLASGRPLDAVLERVHWCCSETLDSLRRALADAGRDVVLLEPLVDLDRRGDLEHWLKTKKTPAAWHELLVALREILAALRRPRWSATSPPAPRHAAVRVPPLRAPPLSA